MNVFDYQHIPTFFKDFLKNYRGSDHNQRRLTAGEWALRLGYRSPQTLSMVIKGVRAPSEELVQRVVKDLKLSRREARYLEILGHLQRKEKRRGTDPASIEALMTELRLLSPGHVQQIPGQTFSYIAQWHHFVIKRLVGTLGFTENYEKIRERLRRKVTQSEIKDAIATMLKLGFLERDADGQLRMADINIQTTFDVPSAALKAHHRQMMARATEALWEQPVDEREIIGTTLWFDRSRISEAKEDIRQFNREFREKFGGDPTSDVYQINVQFFAHTQRVEATYNHKQPTV
jgi:uncharacterized protein (TIGR02147 family)